MIRIPRIITIGTATRDVFLKSDLFKIVHDPEHLERLGFPTGEAQCFALGGKVQIGKPILTIGGGAANSGVTFARQGFRVKTLVKVGRDHNGGAVVSDLELERIEPLVVYDKKLGTAYSVILLSPNGERTILNYRGASSALRTEEIPQKSLKGDWAYIAPGNISLPVMKKIVFELKKKKVKVAMNPSKQYLDFGAKRLKPIFDCLNVIILNREEGAYLTGFKYGEEKKIFKKFDNLVGGLAIMTEGAKGVMVSDGTRVFRAGIYKEKQIIDRTGAGDAFGSGFVAGLIQSSRKLAKRSGVDGFSDDQIINAIKIGSANATSVVEKVGAQMGIITKKDFQKVSRWKKLLINIKKM